MGKKNTGERKSKAAEEAEFNALLKQLSTKSEHQTAVKKVDPEKNHRKTEEWYNLGFSLRAGETAQALLEEAFVDLQMDILLDFHIF